MEILLLFWLSLHFDTGVEDPWKFCCYSGCHYTSIQESKTHGNSVVILAVTTLRYRSRTHENTVVILAVTTLRYRSRTHENTVVILAVTTLRYRSRRLMEIMLLFSLAQHFDIEVEDTWKFCCYSGTALHFDTGVGLMEILLLYSLAQHFDTGVEDSWKFCCHSNLSSPFQAKQPHVSN